MSDGGWLNGGKQQKWRLSIFQLADCSSFFGAVGWLSLIDDGGTAPRQTRSGRDSVTLIEIAGWPMTICSLSFVDVRLIVLNPAITYRISF